jgi:hypothetical protein
MSVTNNKVSPSLYGVHAGFIRNDKHECIYTHLYKVYVLNMYIYIYIYVYVVSLVATLLARCADAMR